MYGYGSPRGLGQSNIKGSGDKLLFCKLRHMIIYPERMQDNIFTLSVMGGARGFVPTKPNPTDPLNLLDCSARLREYKTVVFWLSIFLPSMLYL